MQEQVMRPTAVSPWLASGWTLLRWFSMLLLGIAMLLCLGGPKALAIGQALAAPEQAAPAKAPAVKGAQPAAHPAALTASEHAPRGQQEGIKVHGHWVIEVKNPDGTVTARREFENSLQPAGGGFLVGLIAGTSSSGGLAVLLNGATATMPLQQSEGPLFSEAGPCVPLTYDTAPPPGFQAQSGGPTTGTTCLITMTPVSNGSVGIAAASIFTSECVKAQGNALGSFPTGPEASPCSTNLTLNPSTSSSGGSIQLQGSVNATATASGYVNDVETVFSGCTASTTPGNCIQVANYTGPSTGAVSSLGIFTERPLDGLNGDPTAVPYSPGQTINVSVTISFQ